MNNKKEIPNCAICKWFNFKNEERLGIHQCMAQGFDSTLTVYNNRKCRKLFEKIKKN